MSRAQIVLLILYITGGILSLIRIYVLLELGILNFEYAQYQSEIERYQHENMILYEEILTLTSLQKIKDKAIEQHFIPAPFYYIVR